MTAVNAGGECVSEPDHGLGGPMQVIALLFAPWAAGMGWLPVSGTLGERLDCGPMNTAFVLGWNVGLLFVLIVVALAFSLLIAFW